MTKGLQRFTLLSGLLIQSSMFSWGTASYVTPNLQTPPPSSSPNFPMNDDQGWYVKPSMLIWRPFQGDVDAGISNQIVELLSPSLATKDKTLALSFDWGTGARLAIGRYLPNHENWDISVVGTYFYADTHNTYRGFVPSLVSLSSFADLKLVVPGWSAFLPSNPDTSVHRRLNFFNFDLLAGRQYCLTSKLNIHPFIGIRAALIYEKYTLHTTAFTLSSGTASVSLPSSDFRAWNDYWGVGPRVGTDLAYNFGAGWSFLGSLSGAFLYSRYKIKEKTDGVSATAPTSLLVKDADNLLRTNLETSIGLGWEKWVRNKTVRIAPSFLFETSQWFAFNNWLFTSLPSSTFDIELQAERKNGDLGFMGFTVNLQIDY